MRKKNMIIINCIHNVFNLQTNTNLLFRLFDFNSFLFCVSCEKKPINSNQQTNYEMLYIGHYHIANYSNDFDFVHAIKKKEANASSHLYSWTAIETKPNNNNNKKEFSHNH